MREPWGDITLRDCTLNFNKGDVEGGAVYATGHALTIDGCLIQGNIARYGGGVFADAVTVTIQNSTIVGNEARGQGNNPGVTGDGAGIYLGQSVQVATISNTSVSGNKANFHGSGGGIFVHGGSANNPSAVVLSGVTIAGNQAYKGGGLAIGPDSNCTVTIELDSTIYNNRAESIVDASDGKGGGVYIGSGTLTTSDTLITSNTAGSGGGLYQVDGAWWTLGEGTSVTLNTADDTADGEA